MRPPTLRPLVLPLLLLAASACGGGGGGGGRSTAIATIVDPELIACRARVDNSHRFAEIALRSMRNLGVQRVADRNGPELRARLNPDGKRVVFARERFTNDPDSRELFVSTIDNSSLELRLTVNLVRDDQPVWSPDGERVLFSSERDGTVGLWIANANGTNVERFLPVPAGFADGEADWHAGSDRVVFSRKGPDGRHRLWLVNGSGFGETPLTDGGPTVGDGTGDREPAWSPDGSTIAFVRRTAESQASLCLVDVATGTVSVRWIPDGEVGLPRFTPSMDRLFFGLAEPNAGRQTLRLAQLPIDTGDPVLVWPDERWQLHGIDFVADAPTAPAAGTPVRLDVGEANVEITFSSDFFGATLQLEEDDDNEFYLRTAPSNDGQVAGITCRFSLDLEDPDDLLELRVRSIARTSRFDDESFLRMSVYNPSDNRFDTAVEMTPTSTGQQEMSFTTSSLRHVNKQFDFRVTVIAELSEGDPADLWIDLVEVILVPRAQ